MARVVCVMYDDPADGHPSAYARDAIPRVELYPDGQTTPSPNAIDFRPGELLGDVTGALGLRDFLAARGHTLTITADKNGPDSVFERELAEADIVISQPSWPASLDAARLAKAPKLKLVIVAGVGSDHIDLAAAAHHGITVAEITYSASVSAAEYAVMLILSLVHNAVPWLLPHGARSRTIGDYARRAYDLEGMRVGSIGAGRSGFALLRRLRPFDVRLHYTDPRRLPVAVESEFGLTWHPDAASMVAACDVVSIHCPLHDGTARLFDAAMIGRMRRGAYLVNTGPRGILRSRCHRAGAGNRAPRGLCGGHQRPFDPVRGSRARRRFDFVGPGTLRCGNPRGAGMLVRWRADPRRLPAGRSWHTDRRRRTHLRLEPAGTGGVAKQPDYAPMTASRNVPRNQRCAG